MDDKTPPPADAYKHDLTGETLRDRLHAQDAPEPFSALQTLQHEIEALAALWEMEARARDAVSPVPMSMTLLSCADQLRDVLSKTLGPSR